MNCANHPETAAAAYCRTCGKPLCANCTRDVKGVIYCESCLAERLAGVQPVPSGFVPSASVPVAPKAGPNPALAGILGAIPFGVGAVYNGQYAKGLAHLIIFALLVVGANQGSESLSTICGIGIAFFCIYQIIDAVRSAHAIQAGRAAPDPFGLAESFGGGEKVDTSKIPTAAIVLIGLGTLFLLQTIGVFEFNADQVGPFLLILLGGYLFAKRWGWLPSRTPHDASQRMRGLTGPVFLMTLGVILLVGHVGGPSLHRTWPLLFLAVGITKLLERQSSPPPSMPGSGPTAPISGEVQPPVSEVHNG